MAALGGTPGAIPAPSAVPPCCIQLPAVPTTPTPPAGLCLPLLGPAPAHPGLPRPTPCPPFPARPAALRCLKLYLERIGGDVSLTAEKVGGTSRCGLLLLLQRPAFGWHSAMPPARATAPICPPAYHTTKPCTAPHSPTAGRPRLQTRGTGNPFRLLRETLADREFLNFRPSGD